MTSHDEQHPSRQVVQAGGGAYDASLNCYRLGERMVATVQIDDWVFAVGDYGYSIARYRLDQWLSDRNKPQDNGDVIDCDNAAEAWAILQLVRQDCLVWQCRHCGCWIFTKDRPRVGVLGCSTCGDGGVDFRHEDRHLSSD